MGCGLRKLVEENLRRSSSQCALACYKHGDHFIYSLDYKIMGYSLVVGRGETKELALQDLILQWEEADREGWLHILPHWMSREEMMLRDDLEGKKQKQKRKKKKRRR